MSAWLPGVVTEHDGAAFYKLLGYRSLQTRGFPTTTSFKKKVFHKSFQANYLSVFASEMIQVCFIYICNIWSYFHTHTRILYICIYFTMSGWTG